MKQKIPEMENLVYKKWFPTSNYFYTENADLSVSSHKGLKKNGEKLKQNLKIILLIKIL